jgi:hypothetical protein
LITLHLATGIGRGGRSRRGNPLHHSGERVHERTASGPIPTLDSQALGESTHQIKGQWIEMTVLSVRFYPLLFCICALNSRSLSPAAKVFVDAIVASVGGITGNRGHRTICPEPISVRNPPGEPRDRTASKWQQRCGDLPGLVPGGPGRRSTMLTRGQRHPSDPRVVEHVAPVLSALAAASIAGPMCADGTVKLSGVWLGRNAEVGYPLRMTTPQGPIYAGYRYSAELINYALWQYFRFPPEPTDGRGDAGTVRSNVFFENRARTSSLPE